MSIKLKCSECGHALEGFEHYTVIDGNVFCQDHADEWIKNELEEKFEKYRDQLMEMVGLPALEAIYG